jgi:diaminohydroxyphosphoribosylaminopyrimidine deaminase/5-amino-6-(5-phosphoribosylamino)uracil reductase
VQQFCVPRLNEQTDLVSLLMLLGRRQINSVWVEAGAALSGALLSAGVVDELIVYLAPKLLGDAARGLCHLPALAQLAEAPTFIFSDSRQVGPDLRLTLTPR